MDKPTEPAAKPKNKGGRPRKITPLEEIPPCVVGPRASVKQRQAAFLEATAHKLTLRQACGAAGVTRDVAEAWLRDPAFAARYDHALGEFVDALEETLILQATGRAGRVPRASIQALQALLATHSAAYSRSRADALLRQTGAMQDAILRVLRAHVPPAVLEQIEAEFTKMRDAIEGSGGTRARA